MSKNKDDHVFQAGCNSIANDVCNIKTVKRVNNSADRLYSMEQLIARGKKEYDGGYKEGVAFGMECNATEVQSCKEMIVVLEAKIAKLQNEHADEVKKLHDDYKCAMQAQAQDTQNMIKLSIENICTKLDTMKSEYKDKVQIEGEEIKEFIIEIINKVLSFDMTSTAHQWLERFIKRKFATLGKKIPITVKLHPLVAERMQDIQDIKWIHTEDLSIGDCEMQWENGSVKVSIKNKIEKLKQTLDDYIK